jgi:hypothetical protein
MTILQFEIKSFIFSEIRNVIFIYSKIIFTFDIDRPAVKY